MGGKRDSRRERERERVCVCVCMYEWVYIIKKRTDEVERKENEEQKNAKVLGKDKPIKQTIQSCKAEPQHVSLPCARLKNKIIQI